MAPLIESLRHDMVVKDESFRKLLKRSLLSFVESMEVALKGEEELESKEHLPTKRATRYRAARRETVVTRFSGLQSRQVPMQFGSPTNMHAGCQAS